MRKSTLIKLMCMLVVLITLATAASAAGFTKTLTYTDDTFKDVKSTSWYAKEVASAYELGFMNGKAEGQFSPDGNVTVAEAITMASRVHAIYNGKEIAKADGKWYEMYVKYALENGIIAEGQFDNFNRNIMRYEMAVMFHDAMPKGYYNAINNVKAIPDVAVTEEYHEKLMTLYNAGIVMGSTDFGDFLATNSIKRSETAAIINRVALPENRQKKTLLEYGNRDQAVYLIDNYTMTRFVRNKSMISSAWRYENTGSALLDTEDKSSNILDDISVDNYVAIHRDITSVSRGKVGVELAYNYSKSAFDIVFADINGNNMLTITHGDGGVVTVIGKDENKTDFTYVRGSVRAYLDIDLDKREVFIYMNEKQVGTFKLSDTAADISRLSFITHKEALTNLTVSEVYMYQNYVVNDMFRYNFNGSKPYGWNLNGDVKIVNNKSDKDINSVAINGAGSASKEFLDVTGKFVFETFVFVPASQKAVLSLKNDGKTAVEVNAQSGKFTAGDSVLREYNPGVWQLIRIEGDTDKGKAVVKINNKECLTVDLLEKSIDEIVIFASGSGNFLFDDVELYNVFDYADYVPTPVPVTDDGWYIGMSICSLWREGTHYGWDCISPYDEATPVLGYYDEGLPEVADWEIKFMVEHGYDFQHFCWYVGTSDDGIKEPRLADALHDGFMNAKYSDMQKFMIMWENASGGAVKDVASFKRIVWNYWCDWYFTDSRYLVIDNKPVITIYQYDKFKDQMGGEPQAVEAIKFMRNDIKRLGFDDIILLFCNNGSSKNNNLTMYRYGGDAMVCYGFGENSYDPEYQKTMMMNAYNNGELSLMPSIGVGFNDIGWTETRTPNITVDGFKEMLVWAKDEYMPLIDEREDEAWMSKFLIATTWNEYGEGHYIMPTNLNKFGYIDANRQVFSSVAGKDDSSHFDVEPTDSQKARLCYLFPSRTNLIKRTYWLETSNESLENAEVVKGWNFETVDDCKYWVNLMNSTVLNYDPAEKALHGKSTSNDVAITLLKNVGEYLDADEIRYLRVVMKLDKGVVNNLTMYFKNESDSAYSSNKGVSASIPASDGEYKEVIIDLKQNKLWKGKVTDIRIDPLNGISNYYFKSIEFLKEGSGSGSFEFNIDGKKLTVDKDFAKTVGNDVYVAGDPSDGFYSIQCFYTEFNRWTGKLMLKTPGGTVFNFTVGSDTALVNGKEAKLSSKVETVDGLPMIPITFIYDKAGISYKKNANKFDVVIRGENVGDVVENRVPYEYEFNVPGDLEGWVLGGSTGGVSTGYLCVSATEVIGRAYKFDATVTLNNAGFSASDYCGAEVRIRPNFDEENPADKRLTFYFATTSETALNEEKTSKKDLSDYTPDKDGFYTVYFDLSSNEAWKDSIVTMRFDPTNSGGFYEIDYIRFVLDPRAEDRKKQEAEKQQKYLEADEGKPFYVENPDAETEGYVPAPVREFIALKVVDDPVNEGNLVYERVPDTHMKTWSYAMFPTRFKPGVTYKVEVDIKLTVDHLGNPAPKTSIAWNFRYMDMVDGVSKAMADHHAGLGTYSAEDGWQHFEFTHTISEDSFLRENDYLSFFANPVNLPDGGYLNIGYMIDNIKISVVE